MNLDYKVRLGKIKNIENVIINVYEILSEDEEMDISVFEAGDLDTFMDNEFGKKQTDKLGRTIGLIEDKTTSILLGAFGLNSHNILLFDRNISKLYDLFNYKASGLSLETYIKTIEKDIISLVNSLALPNKKQTNSIMTISEIKLFSSLEDGKRVAYTFSMIKDDNKVDFYSLYTRLGEPLQKYISSSANSDFAASLINGEIYALKSSDSELFLSDKVEDEGYTVKYDYNTKRLMENYGLTIEEFMTLFNKELSSHTLKRK